MRPQSETETKICGGEHEKINSSGANPLKTLGTARD
jgi:hypothetical protein